MNWPVLACVLVAGGCGRISFDPGVGPGGDARTDGVLAVDGPATSDLLLHFAFETADLRVDSAVNPHDGSCNACPTPTAGRVGNGAALFDGTQCLEIPGTRALQPAAFTFGAWLRPRVVHTGTVFGRTRDGATTSGNSWEIWVDVTPASNIAVRAGRAIGPGGTGEWHHYAGTYDGSTFNAYVDGVFYQTHQTALGAYTPDDLAIGCDLNVGTLIQRFDGGIDDVRLYGRVLSAAEIAVLAQ